MIMCDSSSIAVSDNIVANDFIWSRVELENVNFEREKEREREEGKFSSLLFFFGWKIRNLLFASFFIL